MDDATWEEDFLERLGQEESEPEEDREEQQQPEDLQGSNFST